MAERNTSNKRVINKREREYEEWGIYILGDFWMFKEIEVLFLSGSKREKIEMRVFLKCLHLKKILSAYRNQPKDQPRFHIPFCPVALCPFVKNRVVFNGFPSFHIQCKNKGNQKNKKRSFYLNFQQKMLAISPNNSF